MTDIRIVLADDHPIFRDGLRRLLETEPGLTVVGEAATGRDAIRVTHELVPDVLLLDFALPDMSGLDVLQSLSSTRAPVRTVFVTAGMDRPEVLKAIKLGARGVVVKTAAITLLTRCIRAVVEGEYWFGHEHMHHMHSVVEALARVEDSGDLPIQRLTPREIEIIAVVVGGGSNREVARQIGVSEQTVKNHLSHIFDKVGVSSRLELALFALHHKLLKGKQG
jgi:DNA-binding NarL/FixJ family response regulator